ncbi:MAG: hypothetical protein BM564_08910 [Bacteroidetes bacterium MedPE-SWsnd-G2]|nr:MAG: hypothetical protein BM564_08910 [Bacteroidetes bacterium MedPE-SWsnd-G2]
MSKAGDIINQIRNTIKYWWLFLVMGGFLILGGIWVLLSPEDNYLDLTYLFGGIVFVNGVFDIIFAVSNRKILLGWGRYLFGGIMEVLLSIVLLTHPDLSLTVLPLIVGFWLLFSSMSIMSSALDLKLFFINGWEYILIFGITLMLFSMAIIFSPSFGFKSLVAITGVSMIFYGFSYVALSIKLKHVKDYINKRINDFKNSVIGKFGLLKSNVLEEIIKSKGESAQELIDKLKTKFENFEKHISKKENTDH